MARKTIAVRRIVEIANRMLKAPGSTRENREAIAVMLETVLHETGNYHGFNYQASEIRGPGEAGIFDHLPDAPAHQLRVGYDNSRRIYY